jgi:tetratricopeptide (TPR) repeat protein
VRGHIRLLRILCAGTVLFLLGLVEIAANPKDVLSRFLDASLHGRYEQAYNHISAKDKAVKSLREYISEQAKEDSHFIRILASETFYEIRELTVTPNKAKAKVDITQPDSWAVHTRIYGQTFMSAFGNTEEKEEFERILAQKHIPMTTTTRPFDLVKEADSWKVFLDWETKIKIDEKMRRGQQLEKQKKLHAAREMYQEILELSPEAVEAHEKAEQLDEEITRFEGEQSYIDRVGIRGLRVGELIGGGLVVFGEIENYGDRSLTEVEVTIYFLDESGKPVFVETRHPVFVSRHSLDDRNQPLKPNHSKEFGYGAHDVPPDWAKKLRVEITNIEFE